MIRRLFALALIAVFAAALAGCVSININDDGGNVTSEPSAEIDDYPADIIETLVPEAETTAPIREVSVRPAEWVNVQWQPYSCAYFTVNVPSGWQVKWDGNAQKLWWSATSPDGKIGIYNLDHDYAAKDPDMTQTLGFQKPLNDASVEGYFQMIYEDTTDYFNVQNSCVPANKDIIQSSAPNKTIRDYVALYATFKDDTVGEGEGVYSAILVDSNDVYVGGVNYGTWEIDAIFSQWAPLGQLVNWNPILTQIAASFNYTDYYIQEWQSWLNTSVTPSASNDTDPVMEAFEERSKSDTIIQEKRSDMIGEYERVYDNSTGEIYRAYNGFLDDMGDQNRYTPISDNQYTEGYVGWIDKD